MRQGSISAIIVKANASYRCQKCGSDELVQSHHQTPGDDSTQICLCAYHHSLEHPEVPKGLFFSENQQPYWFNKPASRIAREVGVNSRTIIRVAKKLDIQRGDLSLVDEALIIGHLQITRTRHRWGEGEKRLEEARKRREVARQEGRQRRVEAILRQDNARQRRREDCQRRAVATKKRKEARLLKGFLCPECNSRRLTRKGKVWSRDGLTRERIRVQQYLCGNCGRLTIYPRGVK